jgi:hypothetical protein
LPLSLSGQYAFVDEATLAPFLKASWRELFARYPSLERKARTWGVYAPASAESADEIVAAFSRETVRESLRRDRPSQFWLLDNLLGTLPPLRGRRAIAAAGMEDHLVPLAIAAEGRLDNRVSSRTLRAVAKLHDFPNRYVGIELPARLQAAFKGVLRPSYRRQLWYSWQRTLLLDGDSYNCLRSSDTRLFLAFVRKAWLENTAVPDLDRPLEKWWRGSGKVLGRHTGSGQGTSKKPYGHFRDFHVASELYKAAAKASRFKRPFAYWLWN